MTSISYNKDLLYKIYTEIRDLRMIMPNNIYIETNIEVY